MRSFTRAALVATVAVGVACTSSARGQGARLLPDRQVTVRGHQLTMHLAAATNGAGPLLVYATGDGGFPGHERLFDRMMPWGLPLAALSSADYIASIDNPARTIAVDVLAGDLMTIVDAAQQALGLPARAPVVLVGFSRGAGLAVSAATSAAFRERLRGLLAIALTAEEDYVFERVNGADVTLQTYEALPRLGMLRVAVIQSTTDSFVTAAEARRRFGPDSPTRRLRPIEATDHSFAGGLVELEREMKASLDWIVR